MRGAFSSNLAAGLMKRVETEFKKEFPQAIQLADFLLERNYMSIQSPALWTL